MRQTAAVVMLVISWGALVDTGSTGQSDDVEVTIRIHAARSVGAAWTSGARPIVTRILAAAGVRTAWINCMDDDGTDPACSRPPAPSEFVVRIMALPEDPESTSCSNAQTPGEGLL